MPSTPFRKKSKKGFKTSPAGIDKVSSGNVFAGLGLDATEEALAKAELTAKVFGIDQPKASALLRGKLTGFSTERLFKCACAGA